MARNYWFISDTHFFHGNCLKFTREDGSPMRDFSSVEEMNETMVQNWNSVVKKGDLVYHLGDVWMGPSTQGQRGTLWNRLNGSKRLIVGNHDDVKDLSSGNYFQKIMLWRVWNDLNILFTHVPVHESVLSERLKRKGTMLNVHGHTHTKGSPKGPYRSVCVEMVDYTPVNLDEIEGWLK